MNENENRINQKLKNSSLDRVQENKELQLSYYLERQFSKDVDFVY